MSLYINKRLIFLQGRSLGGAVALYMAHKAPELFRGLIIESTFTSVPDIVDEYFPFLGRFKYPVLAIDWNNAALVTELPMPIFYTHGDEDGVVPF